MKFCHIKLCLIPPASAKPKALAGVPAIGDSYYNISQFMYTLKTFFVKELREKYNISYPILQKRFYTRIVNRDKYFGVIVDYIKNNPIKEGLPRQYHKKPYQYFNWQLIEKLF